MTAIDAMKKLADLGYRFEVRGDKLKYQFTGLGDPDPELVLPLLEVVKVYKEKVREIIIRDKAEKNPEPYYDELERYSIKKEHLGFCACGAPAWEKDVDGLEKCWCCLARPGLFGTH